MTSAPRLAPFAALLLAAPVGGCVPEQGLLLDAVDAPPPFPEQEPAPVDDEAPDALEPGEFEGGDAPGAQFHFSSPWSVPEADAWSPGSVLEVRAVMTNTWDQDHMGYPGARLSSDDPRVEIDYPDFWFYGLFALQRGGVDWRVFAAEDLPVGTVVVFTIEADALHCTENSGSDCPAPNPLRYAVEVGF